jgi:hypothetical protein
MLLHQGAKAFEIWTGKPAPLGRDAPRAGTKHLWALTRFSTRTTGSGAVPFLVAGVLRVRLHRRQFFLNVCIYRMPLELSVVSPPSHCPHCKYSIPFYLNIPLVTWLALRGRCKNCGAPISPRYFIVELLTGLAFLAAGWRSGGRRRSSPWCTPFFSRD